MSNEAGRIVGLYDRHARIWNSDRPKSLVERPWLDRCASLLPAGGSILDIGCGSAEPIARHLIEAGFAVTGVEIFPDAAAQFDFASALGIRFRPGSAGVPPACFKRKFFHVNPLAGRRHSRQRRRS